MQISDVTQRLANIAKNNIGKDLGKAEKAEIENEVATGIGDIYEALENLRSNPAGIGHVPSEGYFSEQLTGLQSFIKMAIGAEDRESYGEEQIIENVIHFQHKINALFPLKQV